MLFIKILGWLLLIVGASIWLLAFLIPGVVFIERNESLLGFIGAFMGILGIVILMEINKMSKRVQ